MEQGSEEKVAARKQLLTELAELKNQAMPFALEKKQLETELAAIRSRLREAASNKRFGERWLPRDEYRSICNRQTSLKRRIVRLERQYQEIKAQIRTKQAELDCTEEAPHAFTHGAMPPDEIRRLRDRWQKFAENVANTESAREVAAECSQSLDALLDYGRELP